MGKKGKLESMREEITSLFYELESSTKIAKALAERHGVYSHPRSIRKKITKWGLRDEQENKSTTTTSDVGYSDDVTKTDAFKEYCYREGLDISKVKSAKYVNHDGQQKFNVVLDYNETFEFDWDKFVQSMSKDITVDLTPTRKAQNKKALHLYQSDMHVGAWVEEDSIYENEYSLDVVNSRLASVRALAYKKHDEYGVFDTLALFDLGDMLDGFNGNTTRGGHKLPQNMTNMQQFDSAISAYKTHISELVASGISEKMVFHATCNDNHAGDFSYFALRALAEWAKVKFPQVTVNIQTKFLDTYTYGDHTFILTHGKDKVHMKHGMPKYLDKKTEIYIKDFIDQKEISGNIHVIKGDLHQDCVDFCNRFRYRNVLSLFGASGWVFTNFGYSRAGVSYDVVDLNSKDVMEGRLFFK
jgi:hypothetical protein